MSNVFMGAYVDVLRVLNKKIGIVKALVENKESSSSVVEYCKGHGIEYEYVSTSRSIESALSGMNVNIAVVASFGVILNQSFIDKCSSIYNFHPGDILRVRGRHPLPWTILKRMNLMSVSVHEIDSQEIDAGPLIFQYHVPIDYDKSYKENENRLLSGIETSTEYLCSQIESGDVPSWKWKPISGSYYQKMPSEKLDLIINSERLCEI